MIVQGYHGTSQRAAEEILRDGFHISRNRYDWLGDGVYFFQDGRTRANRWAQRSRPDDWAVLRAEVDLDGCMDLIDGAWFSFLREAYDGVLNQHRQAGLKLPHQGKGARGMDRVVINYAVGVLKDQGMVIRSVRGVFEEGSPAFPGSGLMDESHIQIAVRDLSAIGSIELVEGVDHG